jgi:hypothetical protein
MPAMNLADPSMHHYCILIGKHDRGDTLVHFYKNEGEDIVRLGGRHRIQLESENEPAFGEDPEPLMLTFSGEWKEVGKPFTRGEATNFIRNAKIDFGDGIVEMEWQVIWMDLQGGDDRIIDYLQLNPAVQMQSFKCEGIEDVEKLYAEGKINEDLYNVIKADLEKNPLKED